MVPAPLSIRPFIGSGDFQLSRNFYRDLGFIEKELGPGFSVFTMGPVSFYLQDAYIKDWIDNSQVFVEVPDIDALWQYLQTLDLPAKYKGVRVQAPRHDSWGSECFVHDPAGILWHFGQFRPNS